MAEVNKAIRLSKAAREFNIGISTIVDFLAKKGFTIEGNPNSKIMPEMYSFLIQEFQSEKVVKEESLKIGLEFTDRQTISIETEEAKTKEKPAETEPEELLIKNIPLVYKPEETASVVLAKTEVDVSEEKVITKPVTEKIIEPEIKEEPVQIEEEKVVDKPEEEKKAEIEEIVKEEKKKKEASKEKVKTKKKVKIVGKVDLEALKPKKRSKAKTEEEKPDKKDIQPTIEEKKPADSIAEKEKKPDDSIAEKEKKEVKNDTVAKDTIAIEKPVEKEEPKEVKKEVDSNFIPTKIQKLSGPKILDKIVLPEIKKPEKKFVKKPVASSTDDKPKKKRRKRIKKETRKVTSGSEKAMLEKQKSKFKDKKGRREKPKSEISEVDIQKQIKETLARLSSAGKSKAAKHRRRKRDQVSVSKHEEQQKLDKEQEVIKVTEFVSANELATMMDVPVTDIISTCMSLGLFVSINQRLDAETLSLVVEEFGFKVEFVSVEVQEAIEMSGDDDNDENLIERAPIVTVMGHVDHGKTSLLDHIRKTNVIAGEAGGITQHIGAYEVKLQNDKNITFLDTPGHEAFTAMRARGAKVTDIAIIVIAADDSIMPQTVEAINHAQAAGVPIIFAINKMDKPNANPEKIKEELSQRNILVEDWGGKFQSQEISAKTGQNIDLLLEKVLLEAEMLELKGNPDRHAHGTVIESSLDKGRGYVTKVLIQNGTIKVGDVVLAGSIFGKVKAMYNERNLTVKDAGPSSPILLLGLHGAPQAGDSFNVMNDEREAKSIAIKRKQLQREQGIRTQKHITLDEIGRRIAIGDFKELNIIVRADVDGSVEALTDSLLQLSTEEVQVNIIHKSVGQIIETDVMLASASDAIIIGFQVRPSVSAKRLAEKEQIDIRSYSVIYQATEEIKSAIEGMLAPEIEEKIVCNLEIREVYKITKVGNIAGCLVLDGKINRNTTVRLIRNGIVVYTGKLGSLKRFKDDVKEVQGGYECGLNIENFNDIKVGDIIEGFEEIEIQRKL